MLFYQILLGDFLHKSFPLLVDGLEDLPFLLALVLNFLTSIENVLQVQPLLLAILPLIDCVGNRDELVLLLLNSLLQAFDIARPLNVADGGQ